MSTKADKAESAESKPEKMDVDESATPTDNAKEDAVELTSPEKRKRGRKPKDTTDAQDENDAGQAADENAKEEKGTPKTKKAKKDADVETPGSEARARRERKPTQHYTVEATVKTPKAIEIPEGKGTPLKDIKTIADNIASTPASDDLITGFHTLVWGRAGHKHIKQDILKFKGFNFQSDKEHDLALNKLARWTTAGLKEFAQLLHLESSGTKEVIIDRVFKFLQEPSAAGTKSGGTPRKSKSGSKTPTKSPKASKASISEATPKKRGPKPKPKSVFELYAQEQRAEAVEELDEDASENDIQAKLKELFEELDEADLKQYEEKFDALKTVKTSKAPAKTPSKTKATKPAKTPKNGKAAKGAKSAETVSESENEEEDNEDRGVDEPEAENEEDADDKPLAKKSGDGSPTNAEIVAAIKDVLAEGKLDELTNKKVRAKLAKVFNRDMTDRKLFINECIDKMLPEMQR